MNRNKRAIGKRLLALMLALMLLVTLIPPNVLASSAENESIASNELTVGEVENPADVGENSEAGHEGDWSNSNAANPDHLIGAAEANPVPIIEDSSFDDPYLENIQPRMRRSAGQNRAPAPGAVELTKIVEPVAGLLNTFRVKLRMETTDKEQKNDIVLVIDTSGSMNDNGRMGKTIEAAKNFVNTLLDANHPNTRIALVSFESSVYLKQNFTNYQNKQQLLNAINALGANGGTFTQGGMKKAEDLLNGSGADFKNIVLLSDGVPTFNYKLYNPNNFLIEGGSGNHTHEKQTGTHMPQSEFDYGATAGAGNSMWDRYERIRISWLPLTYEHHYYNSGNCAIAEAGYAKQNANVYTIGVETDNLGSGILNQMASPNCAYNATPEELNTVFNNIAASISSAMQNANVTDPMGAGFVVKGGTASNVQVTQGTATLTDNTINWNVGTLTTPVSASSMTKYAEMTYDVEINDSILDVASSTGQYNTNNGAIVTYTDIDGVQQTKNFPEPTAEPLLVGIYKVLLDSQGNRVPDAELGNRQFTVNVKLNEGGFNKDYVVEANKSGKVMTDIKVDKTYKIKETGTTGISNNLSDYETSIKVERFDGTEVSTTQGTSVDNFEVPKKPASNEPYNTRIIVTNKEKADGKLIIKKEFTPIRRAKSAAKLAPRSAKDLQNKFQLKIVGLGYDGITEVYNQTKEIAVGETLTLENLPYGTYTVTETDGDAYNASYKNDANENNNSVKIGIDKKERSMTITNHPKAGDDKVDVTATKKWINGPEADHTAPAFELYADGVKKEDVAPTITPKNGTANAFTYKWKGLQKYKTDGTAIVYTVKEAGVSADNKLTVNGNTYAVTQTGNDITNTYETPITGEYTATKVWSGDASVTRPAMNFTLWRKAGAIDEAVPGAEVKEVDETTTAATWTGLETTNAAGEAYTFYVKEAFKTAEVGNDNWILGEFDAATNSITNTVKSGEENLGELTIIKKPLENGAGIRKAAARVRDAAQLKFHFKVTGPYGYEKEFDLAPGGTPEVLKNLYFGEYTVTETDTKGYTASYSVADGKVSLTSANKAAKVEVTNTNGGAGTTVEKTVEKVWVKGPKPSTTIELWRTNNVEGTDKIDEKVDEFVVPANASGNDLKKTFTNLAKHDVKGYEFEYYAKEPNVPKNYSKSENGLVVTNTYKSSGGGGGGTSPDPTEIHIAYIKGYPDNTVKAEGKITRAEAAAMVTRLAELDLTDEKRPSYIDVEENSWYIRYLNAALKANMLDSANGKLRPNDSITRAEFAKMLAAIDRNNNLVSRFEDIKGHKYEKEINKIFGNKRIVGYEDGSFKPEALLTRGEAATMLNRMFNRVADSTAIAGYEGKLTYFTDLKEKDWYYYEIVEAANTHELRRRGTKDRFDRVHESWTKALETIVK